MDFFSQLKNIGFNRVKLDITYTDNAVTVAVIPQADAKDDALKTITPLIFTNSVDTMDAEFFNSINAPLEKTLSVFNNTKSYEVRLAEAEQKTKQAKERNAMYDKLKEKLKKVMEAKPLDDSEKTKGLKIVADIKAINPTCTYALEVETELTQGELF